MAGDSAFSDLVLGPKNALYGLTANGSNGTVSALIPPTMGMGAWSVEVIYSFATKVCPSSLTFAPSGTLLITGAGCLAGPSNIPSAVFALTPPSTASGAWIFKTLYTFAEDYQLLGPLTVFKNSIYGCTEQGTFVFQLLPPANPGGLWTENTLYTFPVADGGTTGQVVFGNSGVLFGVTQQSGNLNAGTVYGLSPSFAPGTPWNYHLIHALNGGTDGSNPVNGLSINSKGVLFGFTFDGAGTAFAIYPGMPSGLRTNIGSPFDSR